METRKPVESAATDAVPRSLGMRSIFFLSSAVFLFSLFGLANAWQFGLSMQPSYSSYQGVMMTMDGLHYAVPPQDTSVSFWVSSTTTGGNFAQDGIGYNGGGYLCNIACPPSPVTSPDSWYLFWTYTSNGQYYGENFAAPSNWQPTDNYSFSIGAYPGKGELNFLFTDISRGQSASVTVCNAQVSGNFTGNVGGLMEGGSGTFGDIYASNVTLWAQNFSSGQMNTGNTYSYATSDAPQNGTIDVLRPNLANVGFSGGTNYAGGVQLWTENSSYAEQYAAPDECFTSQVTTISTTVTTTATSTASTIATTSTTVPTSTTIETTTVTTTTPTTTVISPANPVRPLHGSYTIDYQPGWNLFSIPLTYADLVNSSCQRGALSPIWKLQNGKYVRTSYLYGGDGYWIYASSGCSVTYYGPNLTASVLPSLSAGWNMIGGLGYATPLSTIIGNCDVTGGPYGFNTSSHSYYNATVLSPGSGYFIDVSSDCSLGSPSPPPIP